MQPELNKLFSSSEAQGIFNLIIPDKTASQLNLFLL